MLNNKSILITGGTGSLGKELTKTILSKWPNIKRLVIYSRDEQKQFQMAQYGPLSAGLSDPSSQGQIALGNGVFTNDNIQRGDPSSNDHYGFFLASLMIRLDKPATNCFK